MSPRPLDATVTMTRRLPHGGHLDARLGADGRVQVRLDADADVSQVLCELDVLRTTLTRFHVGIARQARTTNTSTTSKTKEAAA